MVKRIVNCVLWLLVPTICQGWQSGRLSSSGLAGLAPSSSSPPPQKQPNRSIQVTTHWYSIPSRVEDDHEEKSSNGNQYKYNDNEVSNEQKSLNDSPTPTTAPQSRLARLAEDWLLEEEEDPNNEWLSYWERFDEKIPQSIHEETLQITNTNSNIEKSTMTTEERLERYLDSRGIRRKDEVDHQQEIQTAIQLAQTAITADAALRSLEIVQPYLQVHTRLGGLALVEYLTASWQKSGNLDEELCRALLENPHDIVVSKVKQLLRRTEPPPRQPSFWSGIFSKDGLSGGGWW